MSDVSDYLDKRLDRLEDKVDEILAFKWQILGGSFVVGALASLAVAIFFNK